MAPTGQTMLPPIAMSTSLTRTSRPADRYQRPDGGSSTARNAPLTPRSPPLSSRSVADVRCDLKGAGMPEMLRRHSEAKKRAVLAKGTPHLLRRAHEMSEKAKNLSQRVADSCDVPKQWRQQTLELVDPIQRDMLTSRQQLTLVWQLLQPPLDTFGLEEYERRYQRLERILTALERAVVDIEEQFLNGEQWAACRLIQLWFRRHLTRRGFYTKRLRINRHHRGLVPGIFDSIPAKSKLTVNCKTGAVTLEYPTSKVERGFME